MLCNVGGVDRALRYIVGAVILIVGILYSSWWGLLGVVILATALFGRCLAYVPFGFSTCKLKEVPSVVSETPTETPQQ